MKKICVLLCMLIPIVLSGCYDMKEVSDELYAIVLAVDKGNVYNIRLSVAVQVYGQGDSGTETKVYSADADDMLGGLNKLNVMLSRKISLLHLNAVIFSEQLAREGLSDPAGAIQNHPETRNAMGVMISQGRAEDLLQEICNNSSGNVSKETELLLISRKYNSFYPVILFENFYDNMTSPYRAACAVYGKTGHDMTCGIALFDEDKMVGLLNEQESAYFMMATGLLKQGLMTFNTKKGQISVTMECKKAKVHVDDAIEFNVDLKGEIEYSKFSDTNFAKEEIARQLKEGITSVIRKTERCGCDVIGIKGSAAKRIATIQQWEKFKPNYENLYVNVNLMLEKSVNR